MTDVYATAVDALYDARNKGRVMDEAARDVVDSVRPIIEAEAREQLLPEIARAVVAERYRIAAEIEARLAREAEAAESIGNPLAALGIRTASWDAARIARGQS